MAICKPATDLLHLNILLYSTYLTKGTTFHRQYISIHFQTNNYAECREPRGANVQYPDGHNGHYGHRPFPVLLARLLRIRHVANTNANIIPLLRTKCQRKQ